jgi:two-component system, OmpR family, phosphate regulon sensor histidine kinase PhoR
MGMKDPKSNRTSYDASLLSTPQTYSMIIDNLPIGFSLVDRDGFILDFNPAAEKLSGYSKEEVVGWSHFEIIHGSKDPSMCPLFMHVFGKHTPSVATEMVLKTKSGEAIDLAVTAFPLFDVSGNFIGGAELFRSIAEQKRLEREYKNLLSMFAHDMKNPVVAAEGFLKRLLLGKAGPLMEKQKEYLAITMQAIAKLQQLIMDFLDFSRIGGKEYEPVLGPYDIEEALRRQIEMLKIAADNKQVQIYFQHVQEGSPVVNADAALIDRVLSNLIDNAIKYTNPGGMVTIRFTNRYEDILAEVLDTGIGIREQDIPCIFDAFCRVNRDVDGTGLGLSIAKAIVEAHHGMISVESTPGKGSRFWFTLPRNKK